MLYLNMGLNLSIKAQKSSLNWWCHLHVGRYFFMKSTMLSFLLILGIKRCILYYLLMFGGPKCENHVKEFVNSVRSVNVLRTAHRHPQVYWNPYLLLIEGFGSCLMYFITGLPLYTNGCNAIFTCVDHLTKYTFLTACTLGAGKMIAK